MFANLSRRRDRQSASPAQARARKRRPSLEALEGRQLMSLGAEFPTPINTTTRNAQFDSDNASSSNGTSVVVWTDTFSLSDHDIRAQRFDRFGAKLGPEIVVSASGLDEGSPSVAIDGQGNFVVSWTQTQPGGDTNVVARRFNSNGIPTGAVVQVGVGTFKESDSDVAIDARGDFVVSYTRNTNNNNPDIFAKLYNTNDQLLNVVSVATTARAETHSSVAETPDGRFDVAWEETFSSSDHDIKLNRYSASGALLGSDAIDLSTAFEETPSVSVDNFDNAVVAYDRSGTSILARRVNSNGSLGALVNIATSSAGVSAPSVALKRGGGGFVVAYQAFENGLRTKVGEVTAFNAVLTYDAGLRTTPAVSINGFDDYILTYTSSDAGDANIRGRRGHLFF
jgi:hypothetical protein